MGRLAMPTLLVQALCPGLGSVLLARVGAIGTIIALALLGLAGLLLVLPLLPIALRRTTPR